MTNPLINYALKELDIPETVEIYKLILTYSNGDIVSNATLYLDLDTEEDFFTLEEKTHPMGVDYSVGIEKMCQLIFDYSWEHISLGTDKKSLYNNHRLVTYIRFVLPDGLLQIDYEDEQTARDVTEEMYNQMRFLFKGAN